MPTYDYVCDACQHRFEKMQSIKADPLKTCPECHADKLRRLIGAGGGLIFKGSGFYITDYRSDSYRAGAKADGGSSSGGESKASSSDSKGSSSGSSSSGGSASSSSGGSGS